MTSARHSKKEKRWGSPGPTSKLDVVSPSRRVLGGRIDLDPSSEEQFNAVVRADNYYSLLERGEDGLALPWWGNVFCNPPGGLVLEFWERGLTQENVQQMVWIGFSIEQFAILIDAPAHPLDFSCCVLRQRIPFNRHDGYSGSPSHANYVCGVGVDPGTFEVEFGPLGKVTHGPLAGNVATLCGRT